MRPVFKAVMSWRDIQALDASGRSVARPPNPPGPLVAEDVKRHLAHFGIPLSRIDPRVWKELQPRRPPSPARAPLPRAQAQTVAATARTEPKKLRRRHGM